MSNLNLNKVILAGRLTADPELKSTPSGIPVTSFTVAVNRGRRAKNGEETQTDFINVTAWRQTAEFVTRYFRKASSICIVGSIQTRNWTDGNGQRRYATEVIVEEAHFVDTKGDSKSVDPDNAAIAFDPVTQEVPKGYEDIGGDRDLPF